LVPEQVNDGAAYSLARDLQPDTKSAIRLRRAFLGKPRREETPALVPRAAWPSWTDQAGAASFQKGHVMRPTGMDESPMDPCTDAELKATVGELSSIIAGIMTGKISPEVVDQRTDKIGARLNEIEQTLATRKPNEN
jgi:hypothetical protein